TAGPVTISIAQDVEGEVFEYEESFFKRRLHYVDRNTPSNDSIERAVKALQAAEKPLMVVGGGAKYSDAGSEIAEFSKAFHVGIAETQAGKSTVTADHPYNMGGLGVTGTLSANKAAKNADVIIGIGTRYTDVTTSSKTAFKFADATLININVSRMQTYKWDALQLVGDAKITIEQLTEILTERNYESNFKNDLTAYKKEWMSERERLSAISADLKKESFQHEIEDSLSREQLKQYKEALETDYAQTTALIKVNDLMDPTSHVVTSAGSLPGDLHRIWHPSVENTYHGEYGYSTMGYEIAGAFGAKLAHPHREVYSMVGDGSFLMLHSEIVTALQYDYKVNLLLFDNSGYGCINNLQLEHGSNSYCTEFTKPDGSVFTVDYAQVAKGYGLETYTATNDQELEAAMEKVKQSEQSTLIHIKVIHKTMTAGYEGFWNVGVSESSTNENVTKLAKEMIEKRSQAKQY